MAVNSLLTHTHNKRALKLRETIQTKVDVTALALTSRALNSSVLFPLQEKQQRAFTREKYLVNSSFGSITLICLLGRENSISFSKKVNLKTYQIHLLTCLVSRWIPLGRI